MLIWRFFCENSPRIIAASGADPAVLKTGPQALVCQFLPNLDTNFTKFIRQCALICTHSYCIFDQSPVFWSPIRTFKMCIASPILVTGSVNGHKMCIAFLIIAKDCDTCIQVFDQRVHSTYANILKNIYKKVKKIVGVGWIG
jgi:hypothetical protein